MKILMVAEKYDGDTIHLGRCVCGPDAPNSAINIMFNNF